MHRSRTTDDPHCSLVGQAGRATCYGSLSEEAIDTPQVGGCSLSVPLPAELPGESLLSLPAMSCFQPGSSALDQKSTANVFSDGSTQIGEGETLVFEAGSFLPWREAWVGWGKLLGSSAGAGGSWSCLL